jgi:predicted AlkP superfamily phosphohydrolase/phosphomutase
MAQTVLIGLDGATFTVLHDLIAAGAMPFLKDFMAQGAHAELTSTPHFISPQAWTSMITGRNPGHHGIFDFIYCRQSAEGVYFTLNMAYDIRCPTLWSILSQKGLRVSALNFLVTYPPKGINGVCVPAFIHARHLRQAVYPPGFYDKIRALLGVETKLLSMDMAEEFQAIQYLPAEQYEAWIIHHIRREEQWFNLVSLELAENPPDLTAVVFDGIDKLQHLCWRFLDPALYPTDFSPWEARIRELCVKYFRQLDWFIREIVALSGSARVVLASDHGFCATETVFFANTWLAQRGYLSWKSEAGTTAATQIADDRIARQVDAIDFERTLAFALNPSSNGIYIRRAEAPNSPGILPEQYDRFRERLVEELQAVIDPYTGQRFFREVLRREEAYPGAAAARAPDLTLIMKDYGFLAVGHSDAVFRRRPEPWGTHHPQGIFIAGGPGIAPLGRMPRLNIIDVAPILLRSLGLPPEPDMEGHCPDALFIDDPRAPEREFATTSAGAGDGVQGSTSSFRKPEVTAFDAEMEAEVLKKLELMGYITPSCSPD